jgi:hypothetical protein
MAKNKKSKMKKTYAKSSKKFSFKNPLLIAVIILVVAVGVFLIIRSFAATVVGAIEGEALTGSGTVVNDSLAGGMKALKLTNSTAARGTVNITANGNRLEVRAKGDQCGSAPNMVINVDGKDVMTAPVVGTTWGPYGQGFNITPGTHTISVRMTNPRTKPGKTTCVRALYIDSIQFQDNTPPPPPPSSDTAAPTVSISSPNNGQVVKATTTVTATANDGTGSGISKLEFYLDSATTPFSTTTATVSGTTDKYAVTWDTTTTNNAPHTLYAKAYDKAGNSQNSAVVSLSVDNSVTAGEIWGDHMGVVRARPDTLALDRTVALGAKWIRISVEQGDAGFNTDPTNGIIAQAHSRGLKVLQACQKPAVNGSHNYSGSATDIASFATYCASWVDKGADAIEIGNEWNHMPFYNFNNTGSPDSTYVSQAAYTNATTNAIRAKSATIPVLNGGWSPEASPNDPPSATSKLLASSDNSFKSKATGLAHHPYQWDIGPYGGKYAFWQTINIYNNAKNAGYNKPVWLTELGGPSTGTLTVCNTTFNFTEATQAQMFKDYINAIKQLRTGTGTVNFSVCGGSVALSGSIPIQTLFWHNLDGVDATNTFEKSFGLYTNGTSTGTIKPAGTAFQNQAAQVW